MSNQNKCLIFLELNIKNTSRQWNICHLIWSESLSKILMWDFIRDTTLYTHFSLLKYPIYLHFRSKNNLAQKCNRFAIDLDPSMYSRRSGITARLHIHALKMPSTHLTKRRQCRCKSRSGLRAVFYWPIERTRTLNPLLLLYTLMNFVRGIFHSI